MVSNPIFQKTQSGRSEIDNNELDLTPLERRVLILVNGSNNDKALAKMSLCKEIEDTLAVLLSKNLIEPIESQAAAAQSDDATTTEVTVPLEQQQAGSDDGGVREFLCNTLLTYGNRVRVAKLIDEINAVESADDLKALVNTWYRAISETPNGVYEADNLKARALKMIAMK